MGPVHTCSIYIYKTKTNTKKTKLKKKKGIVGIAKALRNYKNPCEAQANWFKHFCSRCISHLKFIHRNFIGSETHDSRAEVCAKVPRFLPPRTFHFLGYVSYFELTDRLIC